MKHYVLDADGNVVEEPDLLAWARWFEKTAERTVACDNYTSLPNTSPRVREVILALRGGERDICVSTVFLGTDHNFSGHGPPVLWETIVFGGLLDGTMDRYTSKADAIQGHLEMCERVMRAGTVGPPKSYRPVVR